MDTDHSETHPNLETEKESEAGKEVLLDLDGEDGPDDPNDPDDSGDPDDSDEEADGEADGELAEQDVQCPISGTMVPELPSAIATATQAKAQIEPSIDLILGPMGGGKTTELLRQIERYTIGRRSAILVKPGIDTRSGEHVGTHGFRSAGALVFETLTSACNNLEVQAAEIVGVDESQFFPDLAEGCEALANDGKKVIVAALSGDSNRKAFPSVSALIPKCESLTMLRAVCVKCGRDASFTWHTGGKIEAIKIGGLDEYIPACRKCYLAMREAYEADICLAQSKRQVTMEGKQ